MNGSITGSARLGRRTKDLVKRLGPEDVAIVDHADLDRVSAEELAETGVRAVVNVSPSTTGRFPNPGPLELVRAGIRLIDAPGAPLFEELSDGEQIRLEGDAIWRNGSVVARGTVLEAAALEDALAEQQSRVAHALESFAENTLLHLREEANTLSAGIELPPLETRFRDRHALVVARGPGYKSDLRMVRPYVREFRPVLVAVDGGADALREVGSLGRRHRRRLRLRLGRSASVGRRARRPRVSGRRRPGGGAPAPARVAVHSISAPGISEDLALLLAHEKGASLIVAVGTHFNLVEFLERDREGMASTFVTRLKVGESLVDAKGVSRLVSRRVGVWPLAVFGATGIAAIVVAVLASPALRNVLESITRAIGNGLGL